MRLNRFVRKSAGLCAFLILAVGVSCPAVHAGKMVFQGRTYDISEPGETVPGEIVVRLKPGASVQQAQSVASMLSGGIAGSIPEYNLYLIRLSSKQSGVAIASQVSTALEAARRAPYVRGAFLNYKAGIPRPVGVPQSSQSAPSAALHQADTAPEPATAAAVRNAPVGHQWHLDAIHCDYAGSRPASTPIVAVIDTGVESDHPDLAGRVIPGKDFVDDDMDPADMNGHGTHVAGIIAAKGTYMVRGVSPTTQILAVRVLDRFGSGSFFDVMEALVYARKYKGVKIINLSLEGYVPESTDSDSAYMVIKKVCDDTVARGVLLVVAAGNEDNWRAYAEEESERNRPVPAWFPSSFTVGATQEVDMRTYFSNYDVRTINGFAFNYHFVDIVAPGWNILSTYLEGGVQRMSGTSMAAPVVAGCAAWYWGKNPAKTRKEVEKALADTGKTVDSYYGFPVSEKRVDLMKAMGKSRTGFVGVVYDGQTGLPLKGATVAAGRDDVVKATAKTNSEGFYTLMGLGGGKGYTLKFSKKGFSAYTLAMTTVTDRLKGLLKPVFMNQKRAEGEWSVLIDWRSWHPGYYDAVFNYPSQPAWFPYNWTETTGTFFAPYVASSTATLDLDNRGSLTEPPYMRMTHCAYDYTRPEACFVIKPQSGETYKVYTLLDNNSRYYCWGKYENAKNATKPKIQARIYCGDTLKATVDASRAAGSGPYWHVGDISGSTISVKNELRSSAP